MYKLLIVDDEAIEREAIHFFIKQAGLDFLTIEEAINGIQAVTKASEFMPDIIIMDIKMPGKDGLAAATEIREFNPDCKIIFLTAFHEFDYAQKAIKVKAEDFIIKPAYSEDLIEVLKKVIGDIDKRMTLINRQIDLESRIDIVTKWLESDLLLAIAMGYIEESRINECFARMNISFSLAVCAVIRTISEKDLLSSAFVINLEYAQQQMIATIQAELGSRDVKYLLKNAHSSIYMMIMTNDCMDESRREKWQAKISNCIKKALSGRIGREVQIGIGNTFSKPEQASNSFFQAKIACKSKANLDGLTSFKRMTTNRKCAQYPFSDEKKLCESIVKCDEIAVNQYVEQILNWITQFSVSPSQIKERVYELLTIIDRAVIKEFDIETPLPQSSFDELKSLHSTNEIIMFVKDMLDEIVAKLNSVKNSPVALLIDKVCYYIDQNYQNNITLDEMCDMAGFSKYYFSRIFKQYKNMNLVDYITAQRMGKAKELLKEPKISIKEISSLIGYNDANYLTCVFKKWEGMSPTEYRNKCNVVR